MLQIDDADQLAARQHRHREKRLVAILRKLVERLETRILEGAGRHGHWLTVLRHPSGNTLANAQLQSIDDVGMRRLRRAQHQRLVLLDVDEAGIALTTVDTKSTTRARTACSGSAAAIGSRSRAGYRSRT